MLTGGGAGLPLFQPRIYAMPIQDFAVTSAALDIMLPEMFAAFAGFIFHIASPNGIITYKISNIGF
ncbi:hypothetical protein SDC9_82139 [bioreactor metagenome]|uniref:Uncharacterized protein n=1 Tax=bioreactor metagenome TaxID=1076179 RepID=A0A644Z3W4_9ZZZZ